jgi:hypothetical protein
LEYKKQTIVAFSSTKAGCMTLTKGMKEAIWLRRLFQKIQVLQGTTPTTIFENNQGKLKLAHNPIFWFRTKHVHWMSETISFEKS